MIGPSNDYIFKEIKVGINTIYFVFSEVLCSTTSINEFILERATNLKSKDLKNISNIIPGANIKTIKEEDIPMFINNGFVIGIIKSKIIKPTKQYKLS